MLFLALPSATLACAGTGTVQAKETNFKLDDKFPEFTVFWNSDGACAGNKVQITARYSVSGQTFDVAALDCPSPNTNGNYCVVSGNTYQMVVGNSGFTFNIPGKGNVEAWVSVDGNFVHKTPPLEFTIGGGGGEMPAAQAEKPPEPVEARLTVAINGLTQTSNIAQYLGTIYNWGLTVVTILAVTMLVWGGVKYLTAGGDMSRTGSAKTTISNAVIGLILAFATYLILNTINPALLTFKSIEPKAISRIVATTENGCEDILSKFAYLQISPTSAPTGTCGDTGTLSLKPGQTGQIVTNTCTFKTCPAGLGCGKIDGKYKCVKCQDMTDAALKKNTNSLSVGDGDCRQYAPAIYNKKEFYACVYSNDTALTTIGGKWLGQRGCALFYGNCSQIKKCEDYDDNSRIYPNGYDPRTGDVGFSPAYERSCIRDLSTAGSCVYLGPTNHLAIVCNPNDPCGVGPCKVQEITDQSTLAKIKAFTGPMLTLPANTKLQNCVHQ